MIDKASILSNLKSDLSSADSLRLETVSKVETWKKEYNGEKYGNEQKGKSAIVSRDIKRQDEWQHASLKDPFLSSSDIVKCTPITAEDRAAAYQNQLILNYQFTRKFNRYKFITDSIKLLTTEGTVVIKTSWDYEDEEIEVDYPKFGVIEGELVEIGIDTVKEIKVLKNCPYAEVCRIEDIYLDPTSMGDIDKAQFTIHRYQTDLSTLRSNKIYKLEALNKLSKSLGKDTGDFDNEDDTNFEFKDDPRKKIVVYEYWGNYDIEGSGIAKPIVCTWANDIIIRLQDNPYPDKKIPFVVASHNAMPFQMTGEANAEMIGDSQKLATAIKRGIIDNMANSNNGQKGIRKGSLDSVNRKRFLTGKNFEYNTQKQDFFEGSYNNIPPSVFSVLEMLNNEAESLTGVKAFSGGINGAGLGNTATSARGALDAVSIRRLDIVRNVAENIIKKIMRKWMAYNSKFLNEEEVIRITEDVFVPIRRDDLEGNIDVEIEVSTAEDDSAKSQDLAFILQTLGQSMDANMRNLVMSEMVKLKKMPDLAKQIKEYQPQPDPYAEEMKQLEKQKLMAEIAERNSRALENEVDMRLKTANAVLKEAQARNINSDTDKKDMEIVKDATGQNFEEEMTRKEHDRLTALDLKSVDSLQSK